VAVSGHWIALGNGFERFDELASLATGSETCLADTWPRASAVLTLAKAWLLENNPLPAALAQPVYIRNDVAEKPKARQ
jgi:tRNA A37 threonylcarbamoyladenosine modification protein TsaB